MTIRESVWLDCDEPGCHDGTTADAAHLDNLRAPGEWFCPRHNRRGGADGAA